MKKLFLFTTLCLIVFTIQAQSLQQSLAEEIIMECDGTITEEGTSEDTDYVIAVLPSYYGEELVKISVAIIVRKYSNFNVHSTWRKDDESIQTILTIDDNFIIVRYSKTGNLLVIGWQAKLN